MNKKTSIKIKNISKKKSDDFLASLLMHLAAEAHIDPASVVFLSKLLSREIKPEKSDTREYNNSFISRLDSPTMRFMDVGLKDNIYPGEGVLVAAWLKKHIDNDPELANSLEEVLKTKTRTGPNFSSDPIMPFSGVISEDIGTKYLLRTEQMDTFLSVFNEIEEHRSEFIQDEDWSLIMSAIKKADKRIKNEDIIFLTPVEEGITGKHRDMTEEEKNKFGFDPAQKMDADFRKDEHDLVSLKELAHVMRGNKVDYLSPFAGAFLKYLPELNEAGVRGIVFEVIDDNLKSIKVSKFLGKDKIPHGPTEAAIAVAQCFTELKGILDLKHNVRYYVSVSGFVCGPEDLKSWGYIKMTPKLNKIIPAGECIMFHFIEDQKRDEEVGGKIEWIFVPAATRIYFYPYKPSDLHPGYQKMSVVYGISDNMYHSCGNDPDHKFYSKEYEDDFKQYHPSFNSQPTARYVYNKIISKVDRFSSPYSLYLPHGKEEFGNDLGEEMSNSLYGENEYTPEKYLWFAERSPNLPNEEAKRVEDLSLLSWVLCLQSSFLFYEYTQSKKGGLSTKPVFTTAYRLPKYDSSDFTKEFIKNIETASAYREANAEMDKGADVIQTMKNLWKRLGK